MRKFAPILLLSVMPCLIHGQGPGSSDLWHTDTVDGRPVAVNGTIVLAPLDLPDDRPTNPDQGNLFQYGLPRTIDINFMLAADWTGSTPDSFTGRLSVKSPGATTLNVFFSSFRLAGNARLVIRDASGFAIENLYTASSIPATQEKLQTAMVPGDEVVIEFQGTLEDMEASILQIQNIVHGTMDFFGTGEGRESYECLIDAACSLGDDWRDEIRSVVMFTREDGHGCSGVMLNNTSGDLTPYLYTAHHCRGVFNPNNWVFYFNFQTAACESGTPSLAQSIHGAELVAKDYGGDFDLLLLSQTPPESFGVYYAGWDRTGDVPTDGAIIGHPFIGPKKIATWSGAASTTYPGFEKPMWEVDIVEGGIAGGSSGSPIFNAEKRVVGVALDADVGCDGDTRRTTLPKFSSNWEGSQPAFRLKDWLDPAGTGATTLDGMNAGDAVPVLTGGTDRRVKVKLFLQGAYESSNARMRAQLDVPTTEPYTGLGYDHAWTGGGETTTGSVLQAYGNSRIVDWVVVELRQTSYPHQVVATRSGLLRRDGQVVETDGSLDGLLFPGLPANTYRVAVRHRNHLGIMSNEDLDLSTAGLIDFASPNGVALYGWQGTATIGSARCLWMGDVNMNGLVKYTGNQNDRDQILERLGGNPMGSAFGYFQGDTNMDGEVRYTGLGNDRDALWNVLEGNALFERDAQLP